MLWKKIGKIELDPFGQTENKAIEIRCSIVLPVGALCRECIDECFHTNPQKYPFTLPVRSSETNRLHQTWWVPRQGLSDATTSPASANNIFRSVYDK
jgi:hypothetical protein